MHTVKMFEKFDLHIDNKDWDYICANRLFVEKPSYEDFEAEFVVGTGITPNTPERWNEADSAFKEYINYLKEIRKLHIGPHACGRKGMG